MAIDKTVPDVSEAVREVADGATILVGGFGGAGSPVELLEGLLAAGTRALTVISNNAGTGVGGLAALIDSGAVRKVICSFPRSADSTAFGRRYERGDIELELVPQGTLAERIRAAGAGIGGFYTRTAAGTALAEGKETRTIDGESYLLEYPLVADVALIRAHLGDRWGNLTYRSTGRNFGPVMASAARSTIAQVDRIVPLGELDPEHVVTPGVFVDHVVAVAR